MSVATVYRLLRGECTSPRDNPKTFVDEVIQFIKGHIRPEHRVLSMVSGGIDSSVTTALLHLVIPDRVYVVHVDTGFMRLINGEEESQIVAERFKGLDNFELVDRRDMFYDRVMGILDAERKRLGFREAYEIVTDEQVSKHGCNVMTHGTIYPDIVETEGGIKSQHNVDVKFREVERILEPLAGLYKDEVRRIARYLYEERGIGFLEGLDRRQPFPGPGLSIRVPGVITPEKLMIERQANDIVEQIIDDYTEGVYGVNMYIDPITGEQIPFQSFAATFDNERAEVPPEKTGALERYGISSYYLLGTRTTGVKDGKRVYRYPVCVRIDDTPDYSTLKRIGTRIPEETGFSRVLYEIASGNESSPYAIVIRSVRSVDAMIAGIFEIPLKVLRQIARRMIRECGVAVVYWDISGKPPATIEYE